MQDMKIIGHRGAKGLAPENTLASIKKALELHVDEVEVDVRITKDGVPILMHDRTTRRVANKRVFIAKQTYQELKEIKPDLTTLEEAIKFVRRRTPMRLEVKPSTPVEPTIRLVKAFLQHGWKPKDFMFASFSQRSLLKLQQALPKIEVIVNERISTKRALRRGKQLNTRTLTLSRRLVRIDFIKRALENGFYITPYSVNSPLEAERWQRHGLHGVVTDYPDRYINRS